MFGKPSGEKLHLGAREAIEAKIWAGLIEGRSKRGMVEEGENERSGACRGSVETEAKYCENARALSLLVNRREPFRSMIPGGADLLELRRVLQRL